MRHVLSNGSSIYLSHLSHCLFQQVRCTINGQRMQSTNINKLIQQCLPFLHASGT